PDQVEGARRARQPLGPPRRPDHRGRGHQPHGAVEPELTVQEALQAAFASAEVSLPADGIPTVRVPLAELTSAVDTVRTALGHARFVDLTAVDRLTTEDRFELVYLFYALEQHTWLRLKTRTDAEAPSITPSVPGANWYERELFDLFGITFA